MSVDTPETEGMCVWPCVLYVHATGTTGQHAPARRRHKYASVCSQCGRQLGVADHVAAHVVAYPCYCVNCCCGVLTLKTTCRRCNGRNRLGKRCVDWHSCTSCATFHEPLLDEWLECVCAPWCCHASLAPRREAVVAPLPPAILAVTGAVSGTQTT